MSVSTTTTATEGSGPTRLERLLGVLDAPRDAAGLAVFRVLFGALMLLGVARFAMLGWIDELYVAPDYHFSYLGFEWVRAWPRWGLYLHFFGMGCAALAIMLGYRTRLAAALFLALFTYVELIDKATYLNHYYLVSLLAALLVVVPAERVWSLDAGRRCESTRVPSWSYWLLRGQMAVVYWYAGFAKLNEDWLFRAQPLTLWLSNFADASFVGAWLGSPWVAWGMSWAGMLYDLSIAPLLLYRRTRPFAFATAVCFHVAVWLLFPIGIFPWVMLIGATLFFEPEWPRRLLARLPQLSPLVTPPASEAAAKPRRPTPRWLLCLCALHLVLQVALPLRFLLYPGWVNWNEQGFRFAWRVMLIEKAGQVEFRVVSSDTAQTFRIYPRRELSKLQFRMMSTQPDMIHQYAHHLAERYRGQGLGDVRVYADAWVSLNGRPSQRIIDPDVDLARVPRSLGPSGFIVPLAAPR